MWKFRSMKTDAEEETGAVWAKKGDDRRTPIGAFLRATSIDELPQLWNVVRGEMSLVGPRPLPERDFQRLEAWHKKRYLVLPGITGLWQVSGRSDVSSEQRFALDLFYIEHWSLGLDLEIIVKTPAVMVFGKGAY